MIVVNNIIDNDCVELLSKDGIPYISFKPLQGYNLIQGFSTKLGGVSKGDCESMNLSFTRGDDVEDVKENYRLISRALDFDVESLVLTEQVHSTNILKVGKDDCGDVFLPDRRIKDTDGLVTDEPGVTLMTFFADCVPLLFFDPVKRVIGNAHSGWRGTVSQMGRKMVRKMTEEYGSNPADIIAVIGPSICRKCYEVSDDLYYEFAKIFDEEKMSRTFFLEKDGEYVPVESGDVPEHMQLDLWEANRFVLEMAGLRDENIHCSKVCTCCNHDLLFSHRYTKGRRGNLSAFLGIRG